MPILPIDTGRYGTPEMLKIFDEETKLQKMLEVEAALALAHAKVGNIPREDAEAIARRASTKYVSIKRVKEIESEIKHDVMAIVKALAEVSGPSGGYVHLGATSNDITDTGLALQIRDALDLLEKRLDDLEETLIFLAKKYKNAIMIGRTHGQHALPITFGFKVAIWMRTISRHIERLREIRKRILVGKMSGAVGTQAGFGDRALKVQRLVMEHLGLKSSDITDQIVQRDRYAELTCFFGLVASTLEKIATEIRELQRPEIDEVREPFDVRKQVGSSTMPHKRNPEICERICGLARIIRSLITPSLENISTWHERDLTQSSAERFIIPEGFILLDYILVKMNDVLRGLYVNVERMKKNLELTGGLIMSESVMLELTRKGMSRQDAHEILRRLAMKSTLENKPFKNLLLRSPDVREYLNEEELERALDFEKYLGTAVEQVEEAIAQTERERRRRG